jgi:hypothetical protein
MTQLELSSERHPDLLNERKPYHAPAILVELDFETHAGGSGGTTPAPAFLNGDDQNLEVFTNR